MSRDCEARQFSDQMQCGRCGLAWDMTDPEPPRCARVIDKRAIPERRVTTAIKRLAAISDGEIVSTTPNPGDADALMMVDLRALVPGLVLARMQSAYEQFIIVHGRTCSRQQAMRAALQVYFDYLAG